MNHRYAYCSKDQDPDQEHEEMPLTPGTGNILGGRLADETPLSIEDTQTPHSFLSDSSLDGATEALKEMEEEEDKEAGVTDGQEEEARLSQVVESPSGENGSQDDRDSHSLSNHIDNAEKHLSNQDTEDQNGDLDKCEPSLRWLRGKLNQTSAYTYISILYIHFYCRIYMTAPLTHWFMTRKMHRTWTALRRMKPYEYFGNTKYHFLSCYIYLI